MDRLYSLTLAPMSDDRINAQPRSWISLVLHDIQFWVPVVVLAAGLLVLSWIA